MTHVHDADWAAIKADYDEGRMTVAKLLDQHHISRAQLESIARRDGWTRRTMVRNIGRSTLISRLFKVLEHQISQFETNMMETDMSASGEKEVALLGTLTRNLEKLIDLDQKEKGRRVKKESRTDIDALRAKVAKRLEQLKKS